MFMSQNRADMYSETIVELRFRIRLRTDDFHPPNQIDQA